MDFLMGKLVLRYVIMGLVAAGILTAELGAQIANDPDLIRAADIACLAAIVLARDMIDALVRRIRGGPDQ